MGRPLLLAESCQLMRPPETLPAPVLSWQLMILHTSGWACQCNPGDKTIVDNQYGAASSGVLHCHCSYTGYTPVAGGLHLTCSMSLEIEYKKLITV